MTAGLTELSGMELGRPGDGLAGAAPRPRVLVVDDDPRNLLALSEVLQDVAEIVTASSGTEALRFLLKEQFAVILLDVLMPGIDGYETAKLVRMREQSRDIPIIFLTAINKEDAHLMRGYDSGAVDFVFKPFDPTILRSKVQIFVSLFEKTREIERNAEREQVLLHEALRAQTEKLRTDQALREAEERQALLLRSLPLAVYQVEAGAGAPSFIAGDIESLTGFSPEAFAEDARLWLGRIHPDDRDGGTGAAGEAFKPGEYRWQHRDGSYRVFVDQRVPVSGRDGIHVGTLRDITEQRRLQDQLLQSQKLDAIGKLTGGIAHDFNNLLASVLSGIGLLERRSELDERGRKVLGMMRHAAQQGAHLVNRMLTFSRRQNLQPEVIRIEAVAQALDGLLAPVLGGLVTLSWELEAALWPAFVDGGELELALMNLVINARDAMPTGGTVTITCVNRHLPVDRGDLKAGDYVVLSVADTGTGIPPELLERVLEPFFTTKDAGKGTGLGLSSVLGFAQQSGGTLLTSSVVGAGTVMEVWLPRCAEIAPSLISDAISEPELAVTAGQTILLVDDAVGLRDLTQMHLSDAGYAVTCAASGTEALELIRGGADRFDVIVTDYAMPNMSGLDLITAARAQRPLWPAVIISGYADLEDVARRPSDVPLLAKPFTRAALLQAVRNVAVQRSTH
ncbi:response regulator [Devosia sp. 1566]|uniref:response regulator n=1 Tax=Devosia sp. 1566 TaxID=2499144 RepID=UPI0020C17A1E|nr:response regulator [Devosia sp. 1566]